MTLMNESIPWPRYKKIMGKQEWCVLRRYWVKEPRRIQTEKKSQKQMLPLSDHASDTSTGILRGREEEAIELRPMTWGGGIFLEEVG